MKAIIAGILAAIIVAGAAALILDNEVQRSAAEKYQTDAVRL